MGNAICTSYGLEPPTTVIYKHPHQHCVDCPPRTIIYRHLYPRRMEYGPESPQWAGVAKNLEEYLGEQSKSTKYRREKDKYRCTRPHVDELPQVNNRKSSDEQFHTPPQWARTQAAWADTRPPQLQQDWPQNRTAGYPPHHQAPPNPNRYPRSPSEYLGDDEVDDNFQAQNYHQARNARPSNQRRGAFRGSGRNRHMQDDNRVVYDSDERLRRPHRPERAGEPYDPDDAFTRLQRSRGRHKPQERQYASDPEDRYRRNPHRRQWASDSLGDRQESQDRRRGDEDGEGGVTDGA
ncbi:hypothetical protein MMC18_005515 [Xylographa bjoerkii]|nr:hypothetical protein [Xylographa bjoerkii]